MPRLGPEGARPSVKPRGCVALFVGFLLVIVAAGVLAVIVYLALGKRTLPPEAQEPVSLEVTFFREAPFSPEVTAAPRVLLERRVRFDAAMRENETSRENGPSRRWSG